MKNLYALLIAASIAACCLVDEWRIHRPNGAQATKPPAGYVSRDQCLKELDEQWKSGAEDTTYWVGEYGKLLRDYNKLVDEYNQLAKDNDVLRNAVGVADAALSGQHPVPSPAYILQPHYTPPPEPNTRIIEVPYPVEIEGESPPPYIPTVEERLRCNDSMCPVMVRSRS